MKATVRYVQDFGCNLGAMEAWRMSPGTRRVLQVVGVVLVAVGLWLFGSTAVSMSDGLDPDNRNSLVLSGFGGVLLFGLGGMIASLGFRKPLAELAATETEVAVAHSGAAAGAGLKRAMGEGVLSAGRPLVKVKCHACGDLSDEQSKYCGSCGKAL
jgi:hypothetical protein